MYKILLSIWVLGVVYFSLTIIREHWKKPAWARVHLPATTLRAIFAGAFVVVFIVAWPIAVPVSVALYHKWGASEEKTSSEDPPISMSDRDRITMVQDRVLATLKRLSHGVMDIKALCKPPKHPVEQAIYNAGYLAAMLDVAECIDLRTEGDDEEETQERSAWAQDDFGPN